VATFTKILAATDFSDDSNHALDYAEELARRFSAEILVMHVDQPLAPVMVSELSPGLDVGATLVSSHAACSRSVHRFSKLSAPRMARARISSCSGPTAAPAWRMS
jgi:nucleotide-binding universal stress UspA family protein